MILSDKIKSGSKNTNLLKKIPDLTDKNMLYKQNIDLQKKIDILEESINYYKNLNVDSQKIIEQASKELQKLSLEKSDLIKQVSELIAKNQEFLPSRRINLRISFLNVAKMILRLDRKSIQ